MGAIYDDTDVDNSSPQSWLTCILSTTRQFETISKGQKIYNKKDYKLSGIIIVVLLTENLRPKNAMVTLLKERTKKSVTDNNFVQGNNQFFQVASFM